MRRALTVTLLAALSGCGGAVYRQYIVKETPRKAPDSPPQCLTIEYDYQIAGPASHDDKRTLGRYCLTAKP